MTLLGERPGAGAVAGLLLILAGGWLATDGRLPPGVARLMSRPRTRPRGQPHTQPGQQVERAVGHTRGG